MRVSWRGGSGAAGARRTLRAVVRDRRNAFATLLAAALLAIPIGVAAQSDPATPMRLDGTLARAATAGAVTIGFRESSIPFSYRSARGEPIGYSIDLCRAIVDAMADAVGRPLAIRFEPVTSDSRIAAVSSGKVDLECGSTTANLERRKSVAFSPVFFVAGTKLMVRRDASIRTYRDLGGKRVVTTAGTTNAKALEALKQKFGIDMTLLSAPDHAASFRMLAEGRADAFATDDVLLYGLLAENRAQGDYAIVGDFLSYDPYGIMFRRDDPQLARVVDATFQRMATERDLARTYDKWFLQKLPSGISLDLPMSPQLETILQTLAVAPE